MKAYFPSVNTLCRILFWSWNLIFLVLVYGGLVQFLGKDILRDIERETINSDFIAFFCVLLVTPVVSCILGFRFIKDPKDLFRLMYCIELPILVLALFRVFVIRDMTAGSIFVLALFALTTLYVGLRLFFWKKEKSYWDVAGATAFLLLGLWLSALLSFLVPPLATIIARNSVEALQVLASAPWKFIVSLISILFSPMFFIGILGLIFVAYSATLFVLFPLVYVGTSLLNFRAVFLRHRSSSKSLKPFTAAAGATVITLLALFFLTTTQKHKALLEEVQRDMATESGRRAIGENEKEVREVLSGIYLAGYRYMGDSKHSNVIQKLYADIFRTDPRIWLGVQEAFNQLARPFIYVGSGEGLGPDRDAAERLYEEIFDASIQEEERASIRHAVQATYSRQDIEAGLINIDEERVHLESQEIRMEEKGEFADMEIHEVYRNLHQNQEEIFLHFRLPKGTVVNGLWLGNSNEKQFPAVVSPRGAAQKVYREIVKRGNDPALLEEVGPELYRLRVFPIPPKSNEKLMHMWLSLRLLKQSDKAWELPLLTEKRNLFWTSSTTFSVNGKEAKKPETWLPRSIPVMSPSEAVPVRFRFGNESLILEPRDPELPRPACSLAVLIDGSYSMRKSIEALRSTLTELERSCEGKGLSYLHWDGHSLKPISKPLAFLSQQLFWGHFGPSELNLAFPQLPADKAQVLVLTDRSFFREKEEKAETSDIDRPTWFYMLDGAYPRSMNDKLLRTLAEKGGGVEGEWPALQRNLEDQALLAAHTDLSALGPRYAWKKTAAAEGETESTEAVAAHEWIAQSLKFPGGEDLGRLDELQRIALQNHLVSPYSSMIVLVDDEQRRMLKEAEAAQDRFERDVETGKENLATDKAPFEVSAVPEPEEWALILIVLAFLLYGIYQKQRRIVPGGWGFY